MGAKSSDEISINLFVVFVNKFFHCSFLTEKLENYM